MRSPRRPSAWRLSAVFTLGMLIAACGDSAGEPSPTASLPPTPAPLEEGLTAILVPPRGLLDGPYPRFHDARHDLSITLGTPDIGPGAQRLSFVLADGSGLVRLPVVRGTVRPLGTPEGTSAAPVPFVARFAPFPDGVRGLYATSVEFAHPGRWAVELSVPRPDGTVVVSAFPLTVHEQASAPMVGAPAPASRTRTSAEASLLDLSTGATPDPALYERSIADTLEEDRPFVVVFASPGFCTNALCGPQVEQLTELRADYADRAAFLHVELYENPQEVRARGLDTGRRVAAVEEWGLTSDEWTFVVDAEGRIAARFEGFAPREEVEAALRSVLAG
jgi:hypothetical protein